MKLNWSHGAKYGFINRNNNKKQKESTNKKCSIAKFMGAAIFHFWCRSLNIFWRRGSLDDPDELLRFWDALSDLGWHTVWLGVLTACLLSQEAAIYICCSFLWAKHHFLPTSPFIFREKMNEIIFLELRWNSNEGLGRMGCGRPRRGSGLRA